MEVRVYAEPGMASVNSFVADAGSGVIVIDAQRSLSAANRFLEQINATGKPVLGIFITHPHPDHIGGLPVLKRAFPDAPIYALQATRDTIQTDALGYGKLSKQVLGDDFDEAIPLPDHIVRSGDELAVSGLSLHVWDAGEGEAPCMMTLFAPEEDTLFCADIIQYHMTAFLLEGRLEAWQRQLRTAQEKFGDVGTVYPGHGPSGSAADLFAWQTEYLATFRRLLEAQTSVRKPDGTLTDAGKKAVVDGMNARYPDFLPVAMIPDLLEQNIDKTAKASVRVDSANNLAATVTQSFLCAENTGKCARRATFTNIESLYDDSVLLYDDSFSDSTH